MPAPPPTKDPQNSLKTASTYLKVSELKFEKKRDICIVAKYILLRFLLIQRDKMIINNGESRQALCQPSDQGQQHSNKTYPYHSPLKYALRRTQHHFHSFLAEST